MNIAHSTDSRSHEYQPTIIARRTIISRLAVQIAFFRTEFKRSWPEIKKDPVAFASAMTRELLQQLRSSPNTIPATMAAVAAVSLLIVIALLVDRSTKVTTQAWVEERPETVFIKL